MNSRAFSLIEVLISISIIMVVVSFSFPFYDAWQGKSGLNNYQAQIIETLELASLYSKAGLNNKSHGVYFSPSENTFTLFQGDNYGSRDLSYDRDFLLSSNIILSTNLNNNEIVFNRYDSSLSATGTISLSEKNLNQDCEISVNDFAFVLDN